MFVISRDLAEEVARRTTDLAETSVMKAARELPGYRAFEHAIQSQQTDLPPDPPVAAPERAGRMAGTAPDGT